ncbi:MAG: glycosyltransferase family 2 protein [Chloroflexi bacterium]|nr:glycosyltransferase family 2 protein [Chloroflexota bacterium]
MEPLISVVTPFFNAAHTLRYSLVSLLNQTYQNWECILVDDGSQDDPQPVLDNFRDSRFHYFRLDRNQGRGAARQYALELAQGEYLCFLDADDWIYPQKLQRQLEVMTKNPLISLLSSGLGVENESNQLIGVRGFNPDRADLKIYQPLEKPVPPNIPFAPSMIRMDVAKKAHFDLDLRRSEDADYLLQILMKYHYGLLPEILYIYQELWKVSREDVLSGYRNRILVFRKYLTDFPIMSSKVIFQTKSKILLYRLAFRLGFAEKLILRRSRQPDLEEQQIYQNHSNQLRNYLNEG